MSIPPGVLQNNWAAFLLNNPMLAANLGLYRYAPPAAVNAAMAANLGLHQYAPPAIAASSMTPGMVAAMQANLGLYQHAPSVAPASTTTHQTISSAPSSTTAGTTAAAPPAVRGTVASASSATSNPTGASTSASASGTIASSAPSAARSSTAPEASLTAPPTLIASLDDGDDDDDDDCEEGMPWEDSDWVPTTKSGKQKSPNMIRNELQRYLDSCGRTQKDVLTELNVSSNSFRKFMNPKTYKDPWSACQNGTYWAAARFLARLEQGNKKINKKNNNNKRKAASAVENDGKPSATSNKRAKSSSSGVSRVETEQYMQSILDTTAETSHVYDSCPQVVKKIKTFLEEHPGISKAAFCRFALEGANNNSLARFLAAKKQDQQGNIVYKRAYAFFEKLRIKNNEPKSKARLKNEMEQGADGFDTEPMRRNSMGYICVAGF